jgi:hypothetical protein
MSKKKASPITLGGLAALSVAGGLAVNVWLAGAAGPLRLYAWLLTVAAIILLCACIGKAISRSWTGVIESARNRVSLSRLQMFVWTVLVLSAVLTAGASNFYLGVDASSLSVAIPGDLLAVMGIAATSLVAAPAVLSLKAAPEPAADATAAQGVSTGIFRRPASASTSWLDLFRGDEEGNCATPDLSKIQQFLITVGLVALYGAMIGQMFLAAGPITALPPIGENFVWLMGISHAGYLAYKAVPHPAASPDAQPPAETNQPPPPDQPAG